jgi:hypothetical protein
MSGHTTELPSGTARQGLSHLCNEIAENIEIAGVRSNAVIANRIYIPRLAAQLPTADLAAKVPLPHSAFIVAQIRPILLDAPDAMVRYL